MRAKINQLSKIRVGIVNYLNTKPLLYGIEHSPLSENIELVPDYPSNIALLLQENKIDAGLVPVVILPELPEAHIITNYCIGCTGAVASVCLFSEVPLPEIKRVVLDYQSRTSAILLKILFDKYWKQQVEWIDTKEGFENQPSGTTAALLIGDRCLAYRNQAAYTYDLGEAWNEFTGLPFVFAAWVSNKKLPHDFVHAFAEANRQGIDAIKTVAAENTIANYNSLHYFTKNISYEWDDNKRKGLELFLTYLKDQYSQTVTVRLY